MVEEVIRVGLIGAGGNVRNRHIPGFQQVEGLEIAGVANRTLESSRSVADQFNIPQVYSGWQELLEDDSINAVCIGTWPYMHRTLTLAALERANTCSPRPGWRPRPKRRGTCWLPPKRIRSWCAS